MNAAEVIHFPKPQERQEVGKSMYSDRFNSGYVMSSRLFRREVWPFISDAARNVYAELENRINGHNKDSDFISYSQLQGGDLSGSRQLSRKTVAAGLKELTSLGVISVISIGKQGTKQYQINEISIKDRFTKETSSPSEPVPQGNQDRCTKETETSSPSEHTIDSKTLLDEEEEEAHGENQKFTAQKRQLSFVEYHVSDRTPISLRDLFKKYPAQVDFVDQAKVSFPDHSVDQIFSELKKLGQWSMSASNHMPQKWMSIWLNWMQKIPTTTEQAAAAKRKSTSTAKPQKPKYHQYGQAPAAQSIRDVGGNHE